MLFDLDGTLTDRAATVAAFAAAFVARFQDELAVDVRRAAGGGLEQDGTVDAVASAITSADGGGHAPRAAVFGRLRHAHPWRRAPRPGVIERFWSEAFPASTRPAARLVATLEGLTARGIRLGVVTNGGAVSQRRKIEVLGIRRFLSAIVVSGAAGVAKPEGRIFRLALDTLGADAGQTWFVGDHPVVDVLGARAAGLTPVWRRGRLPWPGDLGPPPAMQIAGLAVLPKLVDSACL